MPNWCRNRVTVFGKEEDISKISDIFSDKKSIFDRIIQSPDWKRLPNEKGEFPKLRQELNKDGSVFYETYDFPDGKNDDRWYHWNIQNWGTKWDNFQLRGVHLNQFVKSCVKCSPTFHSLGSMMNQEWSSQVIFR